MKSYEWMIAVRFLKKGKGQTVLIMLGIALGVAVQFFLASLISGLQLSIIDRTVGGAPHVTVLPADTLPLPGSGLPGREKDSRKPIYSERTEIISWQQYVETLKADPLVKTVSPTVNGSCFIVRGGVRVPAALKGVGPDGLKLYRIKPSLLSGSADLSGNTALFGKEIANRLSLAPGDKLSLKNDSGEEILVQAGGIFDVGSAAGNNLIFLSLERSRGFLGVGGVSSVEAQVHNVFKAGIVAAKYSKDLTRVKIESWQEKNRELLQALSSQSSSSNTIQFFVLLSISVGIASVLGIAAVQKQRQLGILKAMGATGEGAARIFIYQGLMLGVAGSVLGVLAGFALGIMFVSFAPVNFGLDFSAPLIITPVVLACAGSAIASLIPARKASGLSPIEVIRNG